MNVRVAVILIAISSLPPVCCQGPTLSTVTNPISEVVSPQPPLDEAEITVFSATATVAPSQLLENTTTGCTESDASWLAWSEWSTCSDQCGSCGVHIRTRTCLTTSARCACAGESTTVEYCNLEICRYPRATCCYNLKVTSYNGRFACLENSTFTGRVF